MKYLATIFFAFFITTISAQEAAFQNFYKVNEDKSTFSINLSASLASSFLDNEDDNDLMNIIRKSSNFKLMIFNNKDNNISKYFRKFSRKNNLKTLARIKENGSKAELFFVEKNKYITEIIIKANSDSDKMVLFGLKTKITHHELAAMISSSDLQVSSN